MSADDLKSLFDLGLVSTRVRLDPREWMRVERSYTGLLQLSQSHSSRIYGLHTHYGHNVKDACNAADYSKHQRDLLNYLLIGTGAPLSDRVVRRALRLQIKKCAQGQSGIHPETVRDLIRLSDAEELNPVPCQGSLGASGDLVPMAHAISSLFIDENPRGPRDVIGLVNTNSVMASLAIELFFETRLRLDQYQRLLPALIHATGAPREAFDARLYSSRNLHVQTADLLTRIKQDLAEIPAPKREWSNPMLQHRYSMRTIPMAIDTFNKSLGLAEALIQEEALAVADNPILTEDAGGSITTLHGGLFFTSSLATAVDLLNDVQSKLCEFMDRQILNLMDPMLSGGLPDNLAGEDGSHAKGLHQLASALLQRVRTLGCATKSMSFSCESNNQDLVPCTMTALNQLVDLGHHTHDLMRAFAFCALRGLSIRQGTHLPGQLAIQNWSKFDLDEIDAIKQRVISDGVNNSGGIHELCPA